MLRAAAELVWPEKCPEVAEGEGYTVQASTSSKGSKARESEEGRGLHRGRPGLELGMCPVGISRLSV